VIVIGIDPGLASTGYGVLASDRRRAGHGLAALDGGVIESPAGMALERRLAMIHDAVRALLAEHRPDAVALEELYFGQNARTAFAVGQARGVVLLAAGQHGVPCSGYTPQQVKGAVCGSGRAQKDQVARMVRVLLGLAHDPQPDHAADALAVAICHINSAPHAAALARSRESDDAGGASRRAQARAPTPVGSGLCSRCSTARSRYGAPITWSSCAAALAIARPCQPRRSAMCPLSESRSRCTRT
jgi:crossover junction endodeoxyribonuclease RuvC